MKRITIKINGIVQGVGFRPFIHKLVKEYNFCGWVNNTSNGVVCEVEGQEEAIMDFIKDIREKAPKLAFIEDISYDIQENLMNYKEFKIIKSNEDEENKFTLISPDVCTCDDCVRELFDKNNRRYHYPFINCTNCGPRFTIIKDIPYDRAKTTMGKFNMCSKCENEYTDIEDRRYHAQPDCCYDCGPELFFIDKNGNPESGNPIDICRNYIKEGKIVAVKGLGGYHIVCDAKNIETVKRLRKRKHRYDKPFAVMCRDVDEIRKWCYLSDDEQEIIQNYRRPIVLLKKKDGSLDHLSMDNKYIGVMLPYTPVQFLLFEKEIDIAVMTSANLAEMPVISDNDDAFKMLNGIVDGFLMNNRDINTKCDDSLLSVFEGKEYLIRRSRGYVPFPLKVFCDTGKVLALGAEQKASFALSKGKYIFMSQHIGDMKNIETFEHYTMQIKHFKKLFNIEPEKLVCDMHPDYLSTGFGIETSESYGVPLYMVQHHYAHMVSCMADNNLQSKSIGIIWDGTGYGLDGNIWGGEFLVGDYKSFKRLGSIRNIKLIGGDSATKEIYKIAYAMIYDSISKIPDEYKKTKDCDDLQKMLTSNINCYKASSIGRLFDGISSILNIKNVANYEGQGAIALENAAVCCEDNYSMEFYNENDVMYFDWRPMVWEIIIDRKNNLSEGICAAKFMNTLAYMAVHICSEIRNTENINDVVFSGGVFQNIYLLKKLKSVMQENGFNVYTHHRVSTNDESVAFGQLLIAANGGGIKCV